MLKQTNKQTHTTKIGAKQGWNSVKKEKQVLESQFDHALKNGASRARQGVAASPVLYDGTRQVLVCWGLAQA